MEIIGRVSPKGAGTAQTYILLDVKATSTPSTNTYAICVCMCVYVCVYVWIGGDHWSC